MCVCVCVCDCPSQFEDAAKEAADEATSPRPLGEEEVQDIQVMLKMEGNSIQIRQLKVGLSSVPR